MKYAKIKLKIHIIMQKEMQIRFLQSKLGVSETSFVYFDLQK